MHGHVLLRNAQSAYSTQRVKNNLGVTTSRGWIQIFPAIKYLSQLVTTMCSDHSFNPSSFATLFYLNQHAAAVIRAPILWTRQQAQCWRRLLFQFQFGAQSRPNYMREQLTQDSINSTPTSGEKRDITVVMSQGCLGHSLTQTTILLFSQILLLGMISQGIIYHQLLNLGCSRIYP